jgi:hypothetical protein
MAKFIAAALLTSGILSSGCATSLGQAGFSSGIPTGGAVVAQGSDAAILAAVLVAADVAINGDQVLLPPPREAPPDPPGTRLPSK